MRYKDSQEQLSYLKEASNLGNLELFYAALDVLGSTPWTINRRIFDVVLKVWNTGERLGKIPPAVLEDAEPVKPESWDLDPKAKAVYVARLKAWLEAKANNHSNRCGTNYKIEIARTVSFFFSFFACVALRMETLIVRFHSSSTTHSTSHTPSTSAAAPTLSLHTSTKSETTSVAG